MLGLRQGRSTPPQLLRNHVSGAPRRPQFWGKEAYRLRSALNLVCLSRHVYLGGKAKLLDFTVLLQLKQVLRRANSSPAENEFAKGLPDGTIYNVALYLVGLRQSHARQTDRNPVNPSKSPTIQINSLVFPSNSTLVYGRDSK